MFIFIYLFNTKRDKKHNLLILNSGRGIKLIEACRGIEA